MLTKTTERENYNINANAKNSKSHQASSVSFYSESSIQSYGSSHVQSSERSRSFSMLFGGVRLARRKERKKVKHELNLKTRSQSRGRCLAPNEREMDLAA